LRVERATDWFLSVLAAASAAFPGREVDGASLVALP
jgi:hypothetical protein